MARDSVEQWDTNVASEMKILSIKLVACLCISNEQQQTPPSSSFMNTQPARIYWFQISIPPSQGAWLS